MLKTDWENGLVIVVTIIAVLLTDLLSGVGIGFVLAMFFLLRKNYELAFISHIDRENNKAVISFAQIVSFLNNLPIQSISCACLFVPGELHLS